MKTFKSFNFFKFFTELDFSQYRYKPKIQLIYDPLDKFSNTLRGVKPYCCYMFKIFALKLDSPSMNWKLKNKDSDPIDLYKPLREARQKQNYLEKGQIRLFKF